MIEKTLNTDIFGTAMLDFYHDRGAEDIIVHSDVAEDDIIPVSYLFRNWAGMPTIEKIALRNCQGSVLDIGAGSGCHALHLQNLGLDVTAIDISKGGVEVMKNQGLHNVYESSYFDFNRGKYNTLLLLMNGFGLVGSVENIDAFFDHAKTLLEPGGQIIFDSSDLIYIFEQPDGSVRFNANKNYYGEVNYRIEYKKQLSPKFDWLFIDPRNLAEIALKNQFYTEILYEGENYHYLFKLTLQETEN